MSNAYKLGSLSPMSHCSRRSNVYVSAASNTRPQVSHCTSHQLFAPHLYRALCSGPVQLYPRTCLHPLRSTPPAHRHSSTPRSAHICRQAQLRSPIPAGTNTVLPARTRCDAPSMVTSIAPSKTHYTGRLFSNVKGLLRTGLVGWLLDSILVIAKLPVGALLCFVVIKSLLRTPSSRWHGPVFALR
jgi:hypothetical protein